jgi:chromosome segregation ATPase
VPGSGGEVRKDRLNETVMADPAGLARFGPAAARQLFLSISRSPCRDRPSTENQARRRETMDEQTFQTKFNELLEKIKQLPNDQRGRLEHIAEQTKERRKRIQSSVAELQESLDYLRLSVKYLVFDLEATRRENAYLRRLIEQSNRDHNHTHDEDEDYDENASAD